MSLLALVMAVIVAIWLESRLHKQRMEIQRLKQQVGTAYKKGVEVGKSSRL